MMSNLLDDLLNHHHIPLHDVMDTYLSGEYRQRTNGTWDDRQAVGQHFEHLRAVVDHAVIVVHDEITDGHTYADRHTVDVTKRDGGRVTQEVYAFGELDGHGRFIRIEETTLMLRGEETDRDIANAR